MLQLRCAQEPELQVLAAWEGANPDGASWGLRQLTEEYVHPNSTIWVAEREGELVGYAVWRMLPDGLELLNVLVPAAGRRLGVASALLGALHERAGEQPVWLEVRAGNEPALRLYEGLGYRRTGVRRRYYRDGEDAVLMSRLR